MSADFTSVPHRRIMSTQGEHAIMGNLHSVNSDNIFEAYLGRLAEFPAEVIENSTHGWLTVFR